MKIESIVLVPSIPAFIRVSTRKPDEIVSVPIEQFSELELREIGRLWTEALVSSANKRGK